MQIAVTFRHMEADEGIKEYVRGKVEKLQKYIENPREVHVVLSTEKFRQIAEITIVADGMTLNSQGKESDLYAAVDQMVDRMERQIRERRDKSRRKRGAPSPVRASGSGTEEVDEPMEWTTAIQKRQAFAKPMSPEEAMDQLKLSAEDILFFINSNSGQMNALLRSKDGIFEWVEPQAE